MRSVINKLHSTSFFHNLTRRNLRLLVSVKEIQLFLNKSFFSLIWFSWLNLFVNLVDRLVVSHYNIKSLEVRIQSDFVPDVNLVYYFRFSQVDWRKRILVVRLDIAEENSLFR